MQSRAKCVLMIGMHSCGGRTRLQEERGKVNAQSGAEKSKVRKRRIVKAGGTGRGQGAVVIGRVWS